jgi:hypothetical protein
MPRSSAASISGLLPLTADVTTTDGDANAARAEKIGGRGPLEIATRDRDACVSQDLSDPAHPDPADTDEMDVLNVAKIHSEVASLFRNFKFAEG